MKKEETFQYNGNPWEKIYELPGEYHYYNLFKPHESLGHVMEVFRAGNVNRVLDLGCGLGRNTIALSQEQFNVVGMDSANVVLSQLQQRLNLLKIEVPLIQGKFQSIPLDNNSVDAVVSVQTLNHGTEAEVKRGIGEIRRVLRPGGIFFVTVPGRIAQGKVRYCLVETATQIEERTFIPVRGNEIGIPHFIYNKEVLLKHFRDFRLTDLWRDERDYYCLLGEKK